MAARRRRVLTGLRGADADIGRVRPPVPARMRTRWRFAQMGRARWALAHRGGRVDAPARL